MFTIIIVTITILITIIIINNTINNTISFSFTGNFDVVFSSQDPVLSYIEMDSIKSDLTQFTFTAWFKFTIGLKKYNLLSYRTSDEIGVINLQFYADSQSVTSFKGKIIQDNEE